MPSKLELINRVLSQLGKLPVTAISDSEASMYIGAKIDELHPELLLVYDWAWALVYRVDNTPLVSNFSPDYTYSYQLPSNFGKFSHWARGSGYPYYAFVNGMLLANTKPIQYWYVVNNAAYEVLPPLYTRSLVLYAAAMSALFLTNNTQLTSYLEKEYKQALTRAVMQASMEQSIRGVAYNDYNRINYL